MNFVLRPLAANGVKRAKAGVYRNRCPHVHGQRAQGILLPRELSRRPMRELYRTEDPNNRRPAQFGCGVRVHQIVRQHSVDVCATLI